MSKLYFLLVLCLSCTGASREIAGPQYCTDANSFDDAEHSIGEGIFIRTEIKGLQKSELIYRTRGMDLEMMENQSMTYIY